MVERGTTRCGSTVSAGGLSPPTMRRAAAAPNWYIGTLTVVMSEKRASRVSVMPATDTLAGTSMRAWRSAASAPIAVSSLAPMIASGGSASAIICSAAA